MYVCTYVAMHVYTEADLGGGPRGPVPPSKIFYLYVTATINSIKFHSMMFNHY